MGVFSKNEAPVQKEKRYNYDMSHQYSGTFKFGGLYPVVCTETLSGDTWKLDLAFGLRFMPTFFPLQTKIKAKIDFFYVRNRNLWKGFKNYLYMTGNPDSFPVLSKRNVIKHTTTGSLGDYLGLPSTVLTPGSGSNGVMYVTYRTYSVPFGNDSVTVTNTSDNVRIIVSGHYVTDPNDKEHFENYNFKGVSTSGFTSADSKVVKDSLGNSHTYYKLPYLDKLPLAVDSLGNTLYFPVLILEIPTNPATPVDTLVYYDSSSGTKTPIFHVENNEEYSEIYISSEILTSMASFNQSEVYVGFVSEPGVELGDIFTLDSDNLVEKTEFLPSWTNSGSQVSDFGNSYSNIADKLHDISALPFRAYESIYNSFYRDNRNNPYLGPDGTYDPNVFIPSDSGGIDDNDYDLRFRNWEQDFLTTSMPSPQYGNAPLVGITSRGVATFRSDDGTEYTSQLHTDSDDKVVSFSTTGSPSVNRSLMELASSGISIADLRGVNALQRFLETNIRRGLRYRDQVFAHTGVSINEDVLDMPEFIGSFVQTVDVSQINQTSESGNDPLGSYAGQLSCVGGGKSVQKFCDENGYIIGILSVCPVPCYSQLMPKHFLKTEDPLDFYDSAFANLGMQPVTYNEVCPLQALAIGQKPDATFGYQRAWYDYMSLQDSIHGQFRTTMRNFVLTRGFRSLPSLNSDFLTVQPGQLNDVFSISEINGEPIDTILGQIHFNFVAQRRIPRYAIPSLE